MENVLLEYLKYGFNGFAVILLLLAFYLLRAEQRKPEPRKSMLKAIFFFKGFTLVFLILGFISSSFITPEEKILPPENNIEKPIQTISSVDTNSRTIYQYHSDLDAWRFIEDNANGITRMRISGAHLQNGVGSILEPIRTVLENQGEVTILITNPLDSLSLAYAAVRSTHPEDPDDVQDRIKLTLNSLREMKQENANFKLNVRLIDFPLDERIHLIEHKNFSKTAYLKLYPFKEKGKGGTKNGGLYFYVQDDTLKNKKSIYDYYDEKFDRYYEYGHDFVW